MMDDNDKIENIIQSPKQSKREGLSEYSRELINDTRELVASLFPDEKSIDDQVILSSMAINKELARTCIVAILKDMNLEEKKQFKENPGDLKRILLISVEKAQLPEEEKNSIEEKIRSITLEDKMSQRAIRDKLDLFNLDGDVRKMGKVLYKSIKENIDAVQAHAYMNLTER